MPPFGDRAARFAHPARVDRRPALSVGADAIERLGDQARGRGLADPAHPGHQEGMRQPIARDRIAERRSEEHTSELQSLMRISYAVFCLKKKNNTKIKYSVA